MTKTFEIYWDDLTQQCQIELFAFLNGDKRNYDVIPIVTIEVEEE